MLQDLLRLEIDLHIKTIFEIQIYFLEVTEMKHLGGQQIVAKIRGWAIANQNPRPIIGFRRLATQNILKPREHSTPIEPPPSRECRHHSECPWEVVLQNGAESQSLQV